MCLRLISGGDTDAEGDQAGGDAKPGGDPVDLPEEEDSLIGNESELKDEAEKKRLAGKGSIRHGYQVVATPSS